MAVNLLKFNGAAQAGWAIRAHGDKVVIINRKDGKLIAQMPHGAAEEVAHALLRKAAEAEAYKNQAIDKHFTEPTVKRVMGLPVVETIKHLERIG